MNPNGRIGGIVIAVVVAGTAAATRAGAIERRPYRDAEVIVRFQAQLPSVDVSRLPTRQDAPVHAVRTLGTRGQAHTVLLRFAPGTPVEPLAARWRVLPGVAWAEPNYMGRMGAPRGVARNRETPHSMADAPLLARLQSQASVPNAAGKPAVGAWSPSDPDFMLNYPYYILNYLSVYPAKAPSPMVAIVGSGVDALHPDLTGRIVKGSDWVNADADPDDDLGWGTHEAGIVSASINNGKGALGLSNGKVFAVKVVDSQGWWTAFDVASGINEAAGNPLVRVIFFSGWVDQDIPVIHDSVLTAVNNGKLLVFPAGDSVSTPQYPAFYSDDSFADLHDSVISVTASGLSQPKMWTGGVNYGCLTTWANSGTWISAFAPGVAVYAPTPTHPFHLNDQFQLPLNYAYLDGSSEAAAEVAAVAARVWSVMPAGTTAAEVKDRVVTTGWLPVANPKSTMIDTDGDGTTDTVCEPATMNDQALHVEIAAAMGLHQIIGRAFDAQTAAPINKTGIVFTANLNGKPQGIGGAFAPGGDYFSVLAVPNDNTTPYDLRLNVPGYTAGSVSFGSVMATDCGGGSNTHNCTQPNAGAVGLPKTITGQTHIVTNWIYGSAPESHLFTPTAAPIQCDVGVTPLSSLFCFLGSLTSAPFARVAYHGATDTVIPWDRGNDLISIKGPLYPTSPGLPYEIFLRDSGNLDLYSVAPITRVWAGGKIIGQVDAGKGDIATNDCTWSPGGSTHCDVFYVGDLSQAGVFTAKGLYGTGVATGAPGVLPYSAYPRRP